MRNGKISKLPPTIIEQLNRRLDKKENGHSLLIWLNALPEVKQTLKDCFNGVPITKQNLYEWRIGGYRERLLQEDLVDEASQLNGTAQSIAETISPPVLTSDLIFMLAMHYIPFLDQLRGNPTPQTVQKHRLLRGMVQDVAMVQRTIHRASRQKHETNLEKALAPLPPEIRAKVIAKMSGSGFTQKDMAKLIASIVAAETPVPAETSALPNPTPAPSLPHDSSAQAEQPQPAGLPRHSSAPSGTTAGKTQSNPVKPKNLEP